MIEADIRRLNRRGADHVLDTLESDIWARLAARERAKSGAARLGALQVVLLGAIFGISILAGHYYGARSHGSPELSVFSTETPLFASTILIGGKP